MQAGGSGTDGGVEPGGLLELVGVLLDYRRSLLAVPVVGVLLILGVSLLFPNQYRADVSVVPASVLEGGEGLALPAGLQGAAASIGLGLGGGAGDPAALFGPIVESRRFARELLEQRFLRADGDSVRLLEHLTGRSENTSAQLQETVERFGSEILRTRTDSDTGVTRLAVVLDDPVLAAGVVWACVQALDQANRRAVREQAAGRVAFLGDRLAAAQADLTAAEGALMEFQQNNRIAGRSPQLQLDSARLLREREVAEQLYASLRAQYEMARLDQQKDLPALAVLDEATVPSRPFSPRRGALAAISFLLLLAAGAGQALLRSAWRRSGRTAARLPA